jgi:hypothetical protein
MVEKRKYKVHIYLLKKNKTSSIELRKILHNAIHNIVECNGRYSYSTRDESNQEKLVRQVFILFNSVVRKNALLFHLESTSLNLFHCVKWKIEEVIKMFEERVQDTSFMYHRNNLCRKLIDKDDQMRIRMSIGTLKTTRNIIDTIEKQTLYVLNNLTLRKLNFDVLKQVMSFL